MKKSQIDLLSWFLIIMGIVFFYWILGKDFAGQKIILAVLLSLNILGFIVNIKYFDVYNKSTYTSFMGYLATLGFIILVIMLEFLELIK